MMNRIYYKQLKFALLVTFIILCTITNLIAQQYTLTDGDVVVTNGIIESCSYDFSNTDIIIPDTLDGQEITALGDNYKALFYEKGITSIKLPSTLQSIGFGGFGYNKITNITIPESVVSIGNYAFDSNLLTSIVLPESVISIGIDAFNGNDLTNVFLSNSITVISEGAFASNNLTSVTIPTSVTSIGRDAFLYNKIADVIIPNSITSIGTMAFAFNELTSVTFEAGSNIDFIEGSAFNYNDLLSQILLPTHANPGFVEYKDGNGSTYNPGDEITDYYTSYEALIDPLKQDSSALVALYGATDGDNWTNNDNWLSSAPIGEWYGVFVQDGRVDLILFGSYNNLTGYIPSEIGMLDSLRYLSMNFNNLSGNIPSELGQLTNLVNLSLLDNSLTGEIPKELGRLHELFILDLAQNQLTGSIPAELGQLENLSSLHLSFNKLTGNLPPELGLLTKLQELEVFNNQISGNIPAELGQLKNLKSLKLNNNVLTGIIPPGIFGIDSLQTLNLSNNELTGGVVSDLSTMTKMKELKLNDNQIDSLPNLSLPVSCHSLFVQNNKLTFEDLETNFFLSQNDPNFNFVYSPQSKIGVPDTIVVELGADCSVDMECGGTQNLYTWFKNDKEIKSASENSALEIQNFDFRDNGIYSCHITNTIVPDLILESEPIYVYTPEPPCNVQDSLILVNFYNNCNGSNWLNNTNWLASPVKNWYGIKVLGGRVRAIELTGTYSQDFGITGEIPANIGQLDSLKIFDVSYNELSGKIPAEISNLGNLEQLSLAYNALSGGIPSELGQLSTLKMLNLSRNQFSGNIPSTLGDINLLEDLNLSNNGLNGTIPEELWDIPYIKILDLSNNLLTGTLSANIANADSLRNLYLHYNHIEGPIPDQIWSTPNLTVLQLSNNNLSGSLSSAISSALTLQTLFLSDNEIGGEISAELGSLNIESFGIGSNLFEGQIPEVLSNMPALRYLYIENNKFTGSVPKELLKNLEMFFLNDNLLDSLPDIDEPTNLKILIEYNNNFTFEDLEYNMDFVVDWVHTYSPQNLFGTPDTISVAIGDPLTIQIPCGGTQNSYRWYKDSVTITDWSTNDIFENPNFTEKDAGDYYVEVQNSLVTGLTLHSRSITIEVETSNDCLQHFHAVWEGTGGQDHMNINVFDAKLDGLDLEPGDEVGVFNGDVCVGYGKVSQTIDFQNLLSIVVSRDDGTGNGYTSGDEITYKFWDCSESTEYIVNDVQCFDNQLNAVSCSPFEAGGTAYVSLSVNSEVCINLHFNAGWNIFASPNHPESPDMLNVFQPLVDNGSLIKIQDETGKSVENMGVFGGWTNYIGDISPAEGYKIKVAVTDSLNVCGAPVDYPFAIPLNNGWNIMGYARTATVGGMDIVQQLIDNGTLVKVQDETGRSIENMGIFGGWTNYIGSFLPGEGYKIKVSGADTLWLYDSYPKSTAVPFQFAQTKHFIPEFEGNGVDHMNINLVELPQNIIEPGDEIGVFDGTTCVGATTLLPYHFNRGTVPLIASAKDMDGMTGFTEGNRYTIKLWKAKHSQEFELEPEWIKGPGAFTKHESAILSLNKYSTTGLEGLTDIPNHEVKVYPNPFSEEVTVELTLAEDSQVEVEVLNQLGQRIKYLTTKKLLTSGIHQLSWDGRNANSENVSSGIYYLKIAINNSSLHKKIVLSK